MKPEVSNLMDDVLIRLVATRSHELTGLFIYLIKNMLGSGSIQA